GKVVTACCLLALVLATVGLFGLAALGVAQRQRELAIRVGVGARPRDAGWLVAAGVLRVLLLALAVALPLALGGGTLLQVYLFHAGAREPRNLLAAAAVVTLLAALATWVPARRAARTDPMSVLRG